MIRLRLWNNLANIKFKALFTNACSRWAGYAGNGYSFSLAVASAGSVATWAIWDKHPAVWATIVGVSQLLHIARPYVPFIKGEKDYLAMSFEFEDLYLAYEKLWFEHEADRISDTDAEALFYALRDKEVAIEKAHRVQCPKFQWMKQTIQQETYTALALNFESEPNPEEY